MLFPDTPTPLSPSQDRSEDTARLRLELHFFRTFYGTRGRYRMALSERRWAWLQALLVGILFIHAARFGEMLLVGPLGLLFVLEYAFTLAFMAAGAGVWLQRRWGLIVGTAVLGVSLSVTVGLHLLGLLPFSATFLLALSSSPMPRLAMKLTALKSTTIVMPGPPSVASSKQGATSSQPRWSRSPCRAIQR